MCSLFMLFVFIGCSSDSESDRLNFTKVDIDNNDSIYIVDEELYEFIVIKENGDVYYYVFDNTINRTCPWLNIKRKLFDITTETGNFILKYDNNEAYNTNTKLGYCKYKIIEKME